ncbi:ABC transporter permease [Paenibacillus daejeonensis]|uniref:ABC transporter permease n=1 Tax=Paenibacillus daejeonensis TaxID=135193 RepID=UPI000377BD0A|nr:ABC transporter permease [Paenibacillus daejeonensis]
MREQAHTLPSGTLTAQRRRVRTGSGGFGRHFLVAALLPAIILVVWQWAGSTGRVSPLLLPSPLAIGEAFVRLSLSGELFIQLWHSLVRASTGVFYGSLAALLLGGIVGLSRTVRKLVDPSLQLLRLTPSLATAPIIILWFGFGETSKIVIIGFGAFFPLYMSMVQSILGVDSKLTEVTRVLAFGRGKQLTRLVLPAALPGILSGLRLSIAYGWLGLVVAELLGSQSGIGYLMSHAQTNSQPEVIFVGVIIFAVMGKLIDLFVVTIERRLLRWRDSFTGN